MKHKANKVAQMLNRHGIHAEAIHGNKTQQQRVRALNAFKTNRVNVLVATDIAARGIDIDDISHVINYDLPIEPETYVHRIGRTARAGAEGTAYSFCSAEERDFLRDIERLIRYSIEVVDHPLHSDTAKNATGSAARPPPRGGRRGGGFRGGGRGGGFGSRGRSGGPRGGGSGGQSHRGPRQKFGGKRPSRHGPRERGHGSGQPFSW